MKSPQQPTVNTVDYYPIVLRDLVLAFIIGIFVGAFGWLINLFLLNYFIEPVFCGSQDSLSACANGSTIAWVLAHVLVVGASVVALLRAEIYRPLLVALAVLATAWGMNNWLGELDWWSATLWQAGVFALAYGAYAWIARIRQFWLAAVITIAVVVFSRLVLSWA